MFLLYSLYPGSIWARRGPHPPVSGDPEDQIVFSHAGDLFRPHRRRRRPQAHKPHWVRAFARFSPDGQWILFTGEYD